MCFCESKPILFCAQRARLTHTHAQKRHSRIYAYYVQLRIFQEKEHNVTFDFSLKLNCVH